MTITHKQNEQSQFDLSASVLERIELERVRQVPRWKFLFEEYGVWTLWVVSILVGASAFSMLLFFSLHANYALYEVTHDSILQFIFEMIPFVWVLVFLVMALFAHYNLRHTKRGYRYRVWQVLLSSLILSFIGGVLFHLFGMSFLIDSFITQQRLPVLPALQTFEARLWQAPLQGRMLGTLTETAQPGMVVFTDSDGTSWNLYTGELTQADIDTLYSHERVRVIGIPATSTAFFHGCGVFSTDPHRDIMQGELHSQREAFLKRMEAHQARMYTESASETAPHVLRAVCASHAAVERVNKRRSE